MLQPVGAIASLYEEQKVSCVEMIKSFRKYNPDSSIVILCDGIVKDVNDICKEYNCDVLIFKDKLGYPASLNIEVPLTYIHRYLSCSNLIKENFYINLESDCLVTSKLEIEENYKYVFLYNIIPQWLYYFNNNTKRREYILPKIYELYKKHNVYNNFFCDRILGGGGFIYNKKFFLSILNDWEIFKNRCFEIEKIYQEYLPDIVNLGEEPRWFHDYILSQNIQFYLNFEKYNFDFEMMYKNMPHIIHPYKNFYV